MKSLKNFVALLKVWNAQPYSLKYDSAQELGKVDRTEFCVLKTGKNRRDLQWSTKSLEQTSIRKNDKDGNSGKFVKIFIYFSIYVGLGGNK